VHCHSQAERDSECAFTVVGGPVSCHFGGCSLFDAQAEDAEELPLEFPATTYLEETLAGMFGAPHGTTPASKNWARLQAAVLSSPAAECCRCLAYIALGVMCKTVDEDCMFDIQGRLAKNWFDLSLELDGIAEGSRRNKDWLLEAVPAVFVHAIFRMLVEAFPPEARAFAQHSQEVIMKLTQIIQHEVTGLQWRPETWRKLQRRLFCPQVLVTPQLNQRESMEACRRKERRERELQKDGEQPPLHFGDEPMSVLQLESVMALRNERLEESTQRSSSATAHSPVHLCEGAARRLEELKERVEQELGIDRYEDLAVKAEDLITNQMEELYEDGSWEPGKTPPELVCNLGDDPFAFSNACVPPAPAPSESPNKDMKRSQSVRSMRDSTVYARRERERREQEAMERRRRDELLEKYLTAPLPEAYSSKSFDTSLVTPALDRLAAGDGRLLPPLKMLKQKVKMQEPKVEPEPPRESKQRASAKGRQGSKSSVTSARDSITMQRSSSRCSMPNVLSMESVNLKHEVVASRLVQHMSAFREASFDNMKKDCDILTGQKRQRLDAFALQRDEQSFIERMEGLVGSKSTPAIRQLNPFLKKTKSMPKLLGRKPVPKVQAQERPRAAQELQVKVTWDQLTAVDLLRP